MGRWIPIALLTGVIVGMNYASYPWMHTIYTVGMDINLKAIVVAIAATVLALAAATVVWKRMRRLK